MDTRHQHGLLHGVIPHMAPRALSSRAPKARPIPAWSEAPHTSVLNVKGPKARPIAMFILAMPSLLLGCKSTPPSPPAPRTQLIQTPARPSVPPPAFKVFHHDDSNFTLVTKDNASDEEIESLIWQLRDAAHTRTFDKLKISQKLIDARKPMVWFHIYRGTKCASEKYAEGPPPCGGSYHGAGDYTYGGFTNHERDAGALLHDENHEVQLWDPDTPYTPPAPSSSNP